VRLFGDKTLISEKCTVILEQKQAAYFACNSALCTSINTTVLISLVLLYFVFFFWDKVNLKIHVDLVSSARSLLSLQLYSIFAENMV
jgi:hypothetical protein